MSINPDESIKHFASRMKGKAEFCNYTWKCSATGCGTIISYAAEENKDQTYKGLAGPEIQQDTMRQRNQTLFLEELINLIVSKEAVKSSNMARNRSESISKISSKKKAASTNHKDHRTLETDKKLKAPGILHLVWSSRSKSTSQIPCHKNWTSSLW